VGFLVTVCEIVVNEWPTHLFVMSRRSMRLYGMRGTILSSDYVEMKLPASQLRLGDRLIEEGKPGRLVMQVTTRGGETKLSHPAGHTRLLGDPPVRVLRRSPRIEADDELPGPIWRPLGPRRTQPWEGDI
jgi:hypothetical protein